MIKSRKLANTKMKWGSLLGWCDQVLLRTIDEGYDLHSTPCFTTRVSCLVSSTRTPSFWFVFIVKRNRQHMGMIIECLKELGNGGRGGGEIRLMSTAAGRTRKPFFPSHLCQWLKEKYILFSYISQLTFTLTSPACHLSTFWTRETEQSIGKCVGV